MHNLGYDSSDIKSLLNQASCNVFLGSYETTTKRHIKERLEKNGASNIDIDEIINFIKDNDKKLLIMQENDIIIDDKI